MFYLLEPNNGWIKDQFYVLKKFQNILKQGRSKSFKSLFIMDEFIN